MEPKQVIVIRKDLKMRKGKMIAQGSHASLGVITNLLSREITGNGNIKLSMIVDRFSPLLNWLCHKFTKIVVSCDSEEELLELHKKAKDENLLCCLIQDAGNTEFHGVPTYTALAIGPEIPERIDKITGHLKLL